VTRHWLERLRDVEPLDDEVFVTMWHSHVPFPPEFPALVEPRRWNGWVVPRFRREVAELVVDWVTEWNEPQPYGENDVLSWVGDVIVVTHPQYGPEEVTRVEPDARGYYPLGACEWTWSLADGDVEPE
jgi:hypothetical protein